MPQMIYGNGYKTLVPDAEVNKYMSAGYTIVGAGTAKAVVPVYRTQKAKGIAALNDAGFPVPNFEVHKIEEFVNPVDSKGQIALFPDDAAFTNLINKFVRPCPMVPRHGFVDSRPVKTLNDAKKIVNETLAVEEKAELVCMPFVDAKYSAIWTDGKMIIGPSNDGATTGHGSRVIPVLGIPSVSLERWEQACKLANITEAPYLELLWTNKYDYDTSYKNYYVQLRNGPKLPTTIDFIPEKIEVREVVEATGDLLEWETKAKNFTKGTVIYHKGGSLASHYAVHAVLNGIPVLVSREPRVGETLEPTADVSQPDSKQIKIGFLLGCNLDMTYQQAALVMLVGCHSTALWAGKNDMMLGFALGAMYRLIITAALGEYRHTPKNKKTHKPSRNAVYNGVWNKILAQSTRTRYMAALDSFENDNWHGSFGGEKWLEFGRFAGLIFNAVLQENVNQALSLFNQAVHAAHNSGWAFDKFLSKDTLDQTATNPAYTLVKCAPDFYKAQISGEEKADSLEWYKWKKPFKIESPKEEITKEGLARAKAQEKSELREESEYSDGCGDCGDCDCSHCNPAGDNCGYSGCSVCNPKTKKVLAEKDKIVKAQCKLYGVDKLKVQFQTKEQAETPVRTAPVGYVPHSIAYIKLRSEQKKLITKLMEVNEKKSLSMTGVKITYAELEQNAYGNWFLGGKSTPNSPYCMYPEGTYVISSKKLHRYRDC